LQRGGSRVERVVAQRIGGIESLQEEVHDARDPRQVAFGERGDSVGIVRVGIHLDENLMNQIAQSGDDFGTSERQVRMPVRQAEGALVHPLDAKQVATNVVPQRAVGVDRFAARPVDDEAQQGDRAVLSVADEVEVGAIDIDR
jgi:hypothetical protein